MTQIGDAEIEGLKAKAEAAMQGAWEHSGIRSKVSIGANCIWVLVNDRRVIAMPCEVESDYALNFRDAAFIATANPATVLSLIDNITQLRARLKAAERERDSAIEAAAQLVYEKIIRIDADYFRERVRTLK